MEGGRLEATRLLKLHARTGESEGPDVTAALRPVSGARCTRNDFALHDASSAFLRVYLHAPAFGPCLCELGTKEDNHTGVVHPHQDDRERARRPEGIARRTLTQVEPDRKLAKHEEQ